MQAIILAAGQGTRISEYWDLPKCLLKLGTSTIIERQLKSLKLIGVDKAIVVLGYKNEKIESEINHYTFIPEVQYVYNDQYDKKGNTFSLLLGLMAANDNLIILDGDLYYEPSILINAAEKLGNFFVVGDGCLSDIECAKTLTDRVTKNVKMLIDKRGVTAEELNVMEFVGEAMGIIFVDKSSLSILRWSAEEFLSRDENVAKNWEHYFNYIFPKVSFSFHFSASEIWKEIDTKEDYIEARELMASEPM